MIGLKYYTTGEWPFFGPDVVYTQSQIPGALQGLLVGLPFFLFSAPEAPFILLNILSFFSLCLLGTYITKKAPGIPPWIIWGFLFLNPWSMNYSTHIVNPSYVLFGSVLFFVAFFESLPALKANLFSSKTAFFLMGFSILWIMQLHLSWPLLIPFTGISFIHHAKSGREARQYKIFFQLMGWYLMGCLLMAGTLIPTYLVHDFSSSAKSLGQNVVFDLSNVNNFFTILARYLSFACYEIVRFIGSNTEIRLEFFKATWWTSPFTLFVLVWGLIQPFLLLFIPFSKWAPRSKHWIMIRNLNLFMFFIIFLSFFFSIKGPSSHAYYIGFPLVNVYAIWLWGGLKKRWFLRVTKLGFLSILIFYVTLLSYRLPRQSLYKDRERVVQALETKNYSYLGLRRGEIK